MNEDQIRRGSTQSAFDSEHSGMYVGQFALIGIIVGFAHDSGLMPELIPFIQKDWSPVAVGIATFILSIILTLIPIVSIVFLTFITLFWGYVAFEICTEFDLGSGTQWSVAILVTLCAAGLNMSGFQWSKDLN